MRGPDGWRFGVVQWAKSVKPSRLPHYFEKGWSLCGVHDDLPPGYHPQLLEPDHPALKHVCKACEKKGVKGRQSLASKGVCEHKWIMTPWNPTFTDPGKWRLYACLQCGSDFTAEEIEEGNQRDSLDPGLRSTMRREA